MSANAQIRVEVVYGKPNRQVLEVVTVDAGATCEEAVRKSGINAKFPRDDLVRLPFAIWGKPATNRTLVHEGDRIEILRPLIIDPRDARRLLAQAGQYMGGSGRDLAATKERETG